MALHLLCVLLFWHKHTCLDSSKRRRYCPEMHNTDETCNRPHMHCSAPSIVDARPTGPTTALVFLDVPTGSGPVDSYQVTACPKSGGPCVTATCKTAQCTVPGLAPGTTYNVTAAAIINGQPVPATNTVEVSTPPAGAPVLARADDTSATSAQATAKPPPGAAFTQACCTAPE